MIRNKKAMLFCSQMILAGALITGAPCLASGDNGETSVFGSSDTNAEDEVSDLSGEGQIHKPASLNAPDFTSDPNFVDDSTDNTYGYYTIMGTTTVSLAQMTSQYNAHGSEYPSASLKEGGAETIDDFCTIILEEANAEGVRGEVVFEQAMLETGWPVRRRFRNLPVQLRRTRNHRRRRPGRILPRRKNRNPRTGTAFKSLRLRRISQPGLRRHPLQHGSKRQCPIRRMAWTAGKSQWRRLGRRSKLRGEIAQATERSQGGVSEMFDISLYPLFFLGKNQNRKVDVARPLCTPLGFWEKHRHWFWCGEAFL